MKKVTVPVITLIVGAVLAGCTTGPAENRPSLRSHDVQVRVARVTDSMSAIQKEIGKIFSANTTTDDGFRSPQVAAFVEGRKIADVSRMTMQATSVVVMILTITLADSAELGEASGKTMDFVATGNSVTGQVTWVCQNGTVAPEYLPTGCYDSISLKVIR